MLAYLKKHINILSNHTYSGIKNSLTCILPDTGDVFNAIFVR
jgi:hypothetical protein